MAAKHLSVGTLHRGDFSRQFGRASVPIVPHFVHTMRGPNDGTVRSPGRWSTRR
jgi:hypothetical protein